MPHLKRSDAPPQAQRCGVVCHRAALESSVLINWLVKCTGARWRLCQLRRADAGGTRSYLLHCERSSGQYLADSLVDAGIEYGIEVGTTDADPI